MSSISNSRRECIVRISEGDQGAFKELYDDLSDTLFRYISARVKSRDDALDLLQDVFSDLWRSLQTFSYRSDKQFFGFVFTITKRKLARYYDGQKPTVELFETIIDENYETDQNTKVDLGLLLVAMEQLSPKYREVIELRYWAGLSFKEIADYTKTKETTAKVRHHRAVKRLETILNNHEH